MFGALAPLTEAWLQRSDRSYGGGSSELPHATQAEACLLSLEIELAGYVADSSLYYLHGRWPFRCAV